jgi:general secretion pathway protein G
MPKLNRQKGFTTIELLIVILIIIILASISILALNSQRAKARDAKRESDIRQIRTALEFYFSDEEEYPVVGQPIVLGSGDTQKLCSKADGAFVSAETECQKVYMSQIPQDPLPDQPYTYTGSINGYDITYITEKETASGQAGIWHAHSETIDRSAGNR